MRIAHAARIVGGTSVTAMALVTIHLCSRYECVRDTENVTVLAGFVISGMWILYVINAAAVL